MRKFLKKSLIYLIMTMLVLPASVIVGMQKAPRAEAALQETIAAWNFPNDPDNAIIDEGVIANTGKVISTVGTNLPTFSNSGAVTNSARATGWGGGNGTKYWQIDISTLGYQGLQLSSKQRSSVEGPRDFKIQYSINSGLTWTDLTPVTLADNYISGNVNNFSLPSDAKDKSSVKFRWVMSSNVSVEDGLVTSGGVSNIDSVKIEGTAIEVPVESTYKMDIDSKIGNRGVFEEANDDSVLTYDGVVVNNADYFADKGYKPINLTLLRDVVGSEDYPDKVRIDDTGILSDVQIWAYDLTQSEWVDVNEIGYGPEDGLDIAGLIGMNLPLYFVSDKDDIYTANFKLVKAGSIHLVAETGNQGILVDSIAPVITGVENGKVYDTDVTPVIDDLSAKATLNSEDFISGTKVSGEGSYALVVTDKAGNSTTVQFSIYKTALVAPVASATKVEQNGSRTIRVEWQGVGHGVQKYEIYVNGVASLENTTQVSSDDLAVKYSKDIKVLNDGAYSVYVKASRGTESTQSTTCSVEFISAAAGPVTQVSAPVATSVAPAKAQAAAPAQTAPVDDANGQIKGDENKSSDADKVNWTPWIVLFVLIIMAGAATGGYFYWFNGEEELATVVKSPKKSEIKVAPPVKTKVSNSSKKQKRW